MESTQNLQTGTRVGVLHGDGTYAYVGYIRRSLGDDWHEIEDEDDGATREANASRIEIQREQ